MLRPLDRTYRLLKRALDITMGLLLLFVSAPLILLAAAVIRLETRGNPFFSQRRVGLGGKQFTIFKLRGMYRDAAQRFPDLYDYSKYPDLSFYFHYENDPRVTRLGRFLRRTSIDELPNLVNVVLGQMSLVGPRPEIPDVLALYGKYAAPYLSVKPGLTCLSKISGRDRLTKEESIHLDLNYVNAMSFWLDIKILWITFVRVVKRRDAPPIRLQPISFDSKECETATVNESD